MHFNTSKNAKVKKDCVTKNADRLTAADQRLMAQMVERLLCTRRTRFQIPAPAPYEITL
jgi:hypothetical protein